MVKDKPSSKVVSLSEVKDILIHEEEDDMNMRYEKKMALEHATTFALITSKNAKKITKELMEVERMSQTLAFKIAEVLPTHPDDVRAIFAKERFELGEGDVKRIIEIVLQYNTE